jgi:hypothetical protein
MTETIIQTLEACAYAIVVLALWCSTLKRK